MSPFHTPRCRVVWTEVYSGGVLRDVVVQNQSLDLRVGFEVDPTLLATPFPGYWTFTFQLIAQPSPLGPQFQSLAPSGGLGLLKDLPGASLWLQRVWGRADNLVTDPEATYFVFQPRLFINLPGVGTDQFAFPEVPHYIQMS